MDIQFTTAPKRHLTNHASQEQAICSFKPTGITGDIKFYFSLSDNTLVPLSGLGYYTVSNVQDGSEYTVSGVINTSAKFGVLHIVGTERINGEEFNMGVIGVTFFD
jgi:hypothetical protein